MSFGYEYDKLTFFDLDGHLEMLSSELSDALGLAKGDAAKQNLALCRYYKSGFKADISRAHLNSHLRDADFFIFNAVEYTDKERKALWDICDSLTDDEVNEVELP